MKIAVIGSTGYVGNAVVQELAGRGHEVTAFARNTDKVFQAQNVAAVSADVNAADFADKLAGFDAVVSAFNPVGPIRTSAQISHAAQTASSKRQKQHKCLICWWSAAQAACMPHPVCKLSIRPTSPKKFTTAPMPHAISWQNSCRAAT